MEIASFLFSHTINVKRAASLPKRIWEFCWWLDKQAHTHNDGYWGICEIAKVSHLIKSNGEVRG